MVFFSCFKHFAHLGEIGLDPEGGATTPANGYVAEDDVTFYVAEDGTTFYVQEM